MAELKDPTEGALTSVYPSNIHHDGVGYYGGPDAKLFSETMLPDPDTMYAIGMASDASGIPNKDLVSFHLNEAGNALRPNVIGGTGSRTSAKGIGQFLAAAAKDAKLTGMETDPYESAAGTAYYLNKFVIPKLREKGINPGYKEMYTGYNMGPTGGAEVISAAQGGKGIGENRLSLIQQQGAGKSAIRSFLGEDMPAPPVGEGPKGKLTKEQRAQYLSDIRDAVMAKKGWKTKVPSMFRKEQGENLDLRGPAVDRAMGVMGPPTEDAMRRVEKALERRGMKNTTTPVEPPQKTMNIGGRKITLGQTNEPQASLSPQMSTGLQNGIKLAQSFKTGISQGRMFESSRQMASKPTGFG